MNERTYIATICKKRGGHYRRWQNLRKNIYKCRKGKVTLGDWRGGGPIWSEEFAVHITGYILPPKSGVYTFRTDSDDGSWLLINGKEIVNNSWRHPMRAVTGRVRLRQGVLYKIDVWMYEHGGYAGLRFYWSYPSEKKWRVIPIFQESSIIRGFELMINELKSKMNTLHNKLKSLETRNRRLNDIIEKHSEKIKRMKKRIYSLSLDRKRMKRLKKVVKSKLSQIKRANDIIKSLMSNDKRQRAIIYRCRNKLNVIRDEVVRIIIRYNKLMKKYKKKVNEFNKYKTDYGKLLSMSKKESMRYKRKFMKQREHILKLREKIINNKIREVKNFMHKLDMLERDVEMAFRIQHQY